MVSTFQPGFNLVETWFQPEPWLKEEITLPTRFVLTMSHLIATLTIVYDAVRRPPAGP